MGLIKSAGNSTEFLSAHTVVNQHLTCSMASPPLLGRLGGTPPRRDATSSASLQGIEGGGDEGNVL